MGFLSQAWRTIIEPFASLKVYRAAQWPARRMIAVLLLRTLRTLNSFHAFRSLQTQTSTGDTLRKTCAERKLRLTSHHVSCEQYPSIMLHEITPEDTQRECVLLYFHGGGYNKPINDKGHMPVILECAKALGAGRVFVLEYGLAPGLQYPGQLYQAACAMNKMLVDLDCQPEQIVVGGDSAGGNLVLALLAHMKQPHPLIPAIRTSGLEGKLKGAFLISPWVSTTYNARSYDENATKDYLSRRAFDDFTKQWAPESELWADSSRAPSRFWADVPAERMLITVGGFEVLRDDIRALASLIGMETGEGDFLRFVEVPAEIHVQPAVDAVLGLPPCNSFLELLSWCRDIRKGS